MRFLDGLNHGQQRGPGGGGEPGSNERLDQVRSEGDHLLEAADEAIRRALGAGNSQAFLRAGRQEGGQ
jgi:hypothetical protein